MYRKQHPYTCFECSARADEDTQKCSWRHCSKLFCASCAWHCHECNDIICGEHSRVVGTDTYCLSCADQLAEHYEQMFGLLRMAAVRETPCPECGGQITDDSDPFGDRDVEERYACTDCGLSATKRRRPSEALRTAQALRYAGGPALPEADYIVTEGTMPLKKKPAAVAMEERISA